MGKRRKKQESTQEPTDEAPRDDSPLTIEEADAYAHILMLAREQQTRATNKRAEEDADRPRAGLLGTNAARACARRFLIHWFDGERAKKAMEAAHCNWGDITAARFSDPDYKIAFEFIEAERPRLLQAAALDMSERVLDGEEVPAHAARLASFILERCRRDEFGRETATAEGGQRNAPAVVYNINLTAPAPAKMCDQSVTARPPIESDPQKLIIDI